jgi:hypothetical protein
MDYKLLSKNIAEYLLRVFCFILIIKYWFIEVSTIGLLLSTPIYILESLLETYRLKIQNIKYDDFGNITIFDICLIAFFTLYFLAKIFGIFKKLDKLNLFASFIIISVISYLLILVGRINFLVDEITYRNGLEYAYTMYLLIPAFLLYKFFGFLTQKFPFPFEKIGYYTSIEFPKDLYSKIKGKIKNNP